MAEPSVTDGRSHDSNLFVTMKVLDDETARETAW